MNFPSKQDHDSNPTVHIEEISSDQYELDPPRALPDTEPLPQPMPYQHTAAAQPQPEIGTGMTDFSDVEGLDEEYDLDFQVKFRYITCELEYKGFTSCLLVDSTKHN